MFRSSLIISLRNSISEEFIEAEISEIKAWLTSRRGNASLIRWKLEKPNYTEIMNIWCELSDAILNNSPRTLMAYNRLKLKRSLEISTYKTFTR